MTCRWEIYPSYYSTVRDILARHGISRGRVLTNEEEEIATRFNASEELRVLRLKYTARALEEDLDHIEKVRAYSERHGPVKF